MILNVKSIRTKAKNKNKGYSVTIVKGQKFEKSVPLLD